MSSPFPNPPVPIDELIAPTDGDTVYQVISDALVSMNVRADLWPTRGVLRACMTVVSNVIAGYVNDRITATKAGWLPTSAGKWLTWLALYMYGSTRSPATFASGSLRLTNSGGGSYSYAAGQATFKNSLTGKTYRNATAISLAPSTTQTITIQADELGTASNADIGDVTEIVTTMIGVTATNPGPILGEDEQSDESLQLECWNSIAANSAYGPRQAFAYAIQTALNSLTGTAVNINRWKIAPSSHTGQITVTVAGPQGAPDPNDVTGVATNIEAMARPECITVTTQAAANLYVSDALTAYVTGTPGLSAAAVKAAMQTALAKFFASYPIGGRTVGPATGVFASGIYGAILGAWPGAFDATGAADHAMTASQVAIDNTTLTVVVVPA